MDIKPYKRNYTNKKTTKAVLDAILKDIKRGAPNKVAAEANRISESYFYFLIQQGICDIDNENFDTLPAYLVESLRKIERDEIISCRIDIRSNEKSHKGAEWTLEHAYLRHYTSNPVIEALDERLKKLELEKELSEKD